MYADIYLAYPLDKAFTYSIPEGMELSMGMRVKVNFAGRNVTGFTSHIHNNKPDGFEVKKIIAVFDNEPVFGEKLQDLARYTASEYISSVGEALSAAIPSSGKSGNRQKDRFVLEAPQIISLSEEQKKISDDIIKSYDNGNLQHLIFGVTGSGKTEIYIETALEMMKRGKSVIYLVPEISLSSQIFKRLFKVFGREMILYHSGITANQKLAAWKKFYSGEVKIAVGARSAVFLQCPDLGLIIVDEEHDGSYKENSTPRYNARRLAFYRSKKENSLLIMGSATPSIESLYAAEKGIMQLHKIEKRFGIATLPKIEIVKTTGREKGLLSSVLKLHIKRAVDSGKQAILLLNRRGFSPLVVCADCGTTVECPSCSISMNYHREGNLLCHYCGFTKPFPEVCGKCGSAGMEKVGSGTQKIEDEISEEFKDFRIFRLDQDTSRKKDASYNLIEDMSCGNIDILLGTQMVAKGFDFANVTVAGVLSADIGLHIPDFRATERIFSLLMQVSGRSGRGDSPGKVIIQTYDPENPVYKFLLDQDYAGFYKNESLARKAMNYPPFSRLARLLIRGEDETEVIKASEKLKFSLAQSIEKNKLNIILLGPSSAPITKIAKNFRHHIILKSRSIDDLRKVILESRGSVSGNRLYLEIDMDPYEML